MPSLTPPITAIVLAAGSASRFGGHKLMQPISHKSLSQHKNNSPIGLVSALNVKQHVNEVICIVREGDSELATCLENSGLRVLINANASQGVSSSIRTGIKAAHPDHAIMICLADMPLIKADSYQALIRHYSLSPLAVTRPQVTISGKCKPGHPVIFPPHITPKLMQLTGDNGANKLLKELTVSTLLLDDPGVSLDIDTNEDLIHLRSVK